MDSVWLSRSHILFSSFQSFLIWTLLSFGGFSSVDETDNITAPYAVTYNQISHKGTQAEQQEAIFVRRMIWVIEQQSVLI
jgi:hypothetical protein